MLTQELLDRVTSKMEWCRQVILTKYGKDIQPRLTFDLKGTSAGKGGFNNGPFVRLNPILLAENTDDMIDDTIPHEFAHACQYTIYPRNRLINKPHGHYWELFMRAFGRNPTRCHSYDVTNAQVRVHRKVQFVCACGPHAITLRRARQIQNGAKIYCKTCNYYLVPPGQTPTRKKARKAIIVPVVQFQPQVVPTPEPAINVPIRTIKTIFDKSTMTLRNVEVIA